MKRTLSLHLLLPILVLVVLALVARASGPLCWDKADRPKAAAEDGRATPEEGRATQEDGRAT